MSLNMGIHPYSLYQSWCGHVLGIQNTCAQTYSISCTSTTFGPLGFSIQTLRFAAAFQVFWLGFGVWRCFPLHQLLAFAFDVQEGCMKGLGLAWLGLSCCISLHGDATWRVCVIPQILKHLLQNLRLTMTLYLSVHVVINELAVARVGQVERYQSAFNYELKMCIELMH